MGALADAIARLESGGTSSGAAANLAQNPSMVSGQYGQYSGFAQQYGLGEAGINNYAAQTLRANPNATFGDFYAGYVRGTGTPGAYSLSDLQAVNAGGQRGAEGAFTNLMNNSPIDPNAPLSNYVTGSGTIPADGVPQGGQGFNFGNVDTAQVSANNDQLFGPPVSNFDSRFNSAFPNRGGTDTSLFSSSDPIDTSGQNASGFSQSWAPETFSLDQGSFSGTPQVAAPQATIQQAVDSGTASQSASSAASSAGSGGSGAGIQGTGSGLQIQVGPQPGLSQLVSSTAKDVEQSFGAEAQKIASDAVASITNYFGITGNLFVRFGLILLGVVVIGVALSKLMGGPSAKDIGLAVATAVK